MKRITLLSMALAIGLAGMVQSCSKEKESPNPSAQNPNNPNNPNNPPGSTDTLALFADKGWQIDKVYKDGVEQSGSFLLQCSYSINKDGNYFFNIPNFPSANGTWSFDASGKRKVNFFNQGNGFVWNIISINTSKLVVEQPEDDGSVLKLEMSL